MKKRSKRFKKFQFERRFFMKLKNAYVKHHLHLKTGKEYACQAGHVPIGTREMIYFDKKTIQHDEKAGMKTCIV